MSLYSRYLVPRMVDHGMRGDNINALRALVLAPVRGRVLEIGFGTGLNARHYPKDLDELVVIEPNDGMSRLARKRLALAGLTARHEVLSGESLPFPDQSFDAVVSTFTLCTIPDVDLALQELRRVLAPGGALHFVEHNLADTEADRAWQRRINPLWRAFAGGCNLTRDVPELLATNGLKLTELVSARLPDTSAIFGTIRRGVAVPR